MGRVALYCSLALLLALIVWGIILTVKRINARLTAQREGLALKGDLNRSQERDILDFINTADAIFGDMERSAIGSSLSADFTILSEIHRAKVAAWRRSYASLKEKLPS